MSRACLAGPRTSSGRGFTPTESAHCQHIDSEEAGLEARGPARRSTVLAIAIAAVLACGTAGAQTQSTTPTTDPGTKLAFPASLGGATFERVVNYAGPPSNRPDLGSSY